MILNYCINGLHHNLRLTSSKKCAVAIIFFVFTLKTKRSLFWDDELTDIYHQICGFPQSKLRKIRMFFPFSFDKINN